MGAPLLLENSPEESEAHRRSMLAESDELLDGVESLRLRDRTTVPPQLAAAIRSLQIRLGRPDATSPHTVRAAHQLVFAVQQRLMAANPDNPQPRGHVGRAAGAPKIARLPKAGPWKFLALPPRGGRSEAQWQELVELTVLRALDRWCWAQNVAADSARRQRRSARRAVARADAAWVNYWELRCEAEVLLGHTLPADGEARPP